MKACFPPVTDSNTRLLILGSLPGEESLKQQRYYAHPRNQFWALAGEVIGEDLSAMDYDSRLAALIRHHIGLWDVVASAERKGSLDTHIRNAAGNDLAAIAGSLPRLAAIAFNGTAAARIGLKQLGDETGRYRIIRLPSSSPAHTLSIEEKRAAWMRLRDVLHPQG